MNKNEMEQHLINEAKKGFESAAFYIGDSFYTIRSMGLSDTHFIGDTKHIAELLDIDYPSIFIHSHIDSNATPSSTDLDMMDTWDMEWIIYSIIGGEIDEIWSSIQSKGS